MPERVIDHLETIEVEAQEGADIARRGEGYRLLQAIAEQRPVRQFGQSVVLGHKSQARLGLPAFGDILVCRHPAAVDQRLIVHRHGPSVVQAVDDVEWCGSGDRPGAPCQIIGFGHRNEGVAGDPTVQDVRQRGPGACLFRRESVNLAVAAVADQKPLVPVEKS